MSKLTFQIVQVDKDGNELKYEATIGSQATSKDGILKQIKGRLYHLMLLRKQTKSQCGLKMNLPIGFIFKVGGKSVNTLTIAEQLNVSLRIGYSAARRKKFFNTVDGIVDFMLRGDKAYNDTEIEAIEAEIAEFVKAEAEAREAAKELAEAEVSNN